MGLGDTNGRFANLYKRNIIPISMVMLKGVEFREIKLRDSYNRRALQSKNKIISAIKLFGLTEDDAEIKLENFAMRKAQATASWWMLREHLFFSYNGSDKFAENIAMVAQVIEHFCHLLYDKQITEEKFLELFVEDGDIVEQRKHARKVLGVEENSIDFETMHKNYKKLSKECHPDMPNGSTEKFKELNVAHKVVKKELSAL